jgi:ERCC4-type nuclease
MDIKLYIDDRERAVTLHKDDLVGINYEIKRLTTADYIVVNATTGVVLAAIERKSLEDFAASIKDGRSENINKLCDFRQKSGCRIIYLIEGDFAPKPNKEYGHIPYKNIESSIFHLIIRDNICVLKTKDTLDTAQTLARFITSMRTLKEFEPTQELPSEVKIGNAELTEMITMRHIKSDLDIVREMWAVFKGISVESSDEYVRVWALYDIICGKIARETISTHKLTTGRTINKTAVNSLFAADHATQRKILACVPGISSKATGTILMNMDLKTLICLPLEELAKIKCSEKKVLGNKCSEAILRLFTFKSG